MQAIVCWVRGGALHRTELLVPFSEFFNHRSLLFDNTFALILFVLSLPQLVREGHPLENAFITVQLWAGPSDLERYKGLLLCRYGMFWPFLRPQQFLLHHSATNWLEVSFWGCITKAELSCSKWWAIWLICPIIGCFVSMWFTLSPEKVFLSLLFAI